MSEMFWYKNYVFWNKKGGVIRIKSFFGKSVKVSELQSTELTDKMLTIAQTDKERIIIDLNHIYEEDCQKLNTIVGNSVS
jgi:acyl-ACP thioesterase